MPKICLAKAVFQASGTHLLKELGPLKKSRKTLQVLSVWESTPRLRLPTYAQSFIPPLGKTIIVFTIVL